MFCTSCGATVAPDAAVCAACGRPQGATTAERQAAQLGDRLAGSGKDAAFVFRTMLVSPVGGLAQAYAELGAERAMWAGVALAVGFGLAVGFAATRAASGAGELLGGLSGFLRPQTPEVSFVKVAFEALVFPAAIAGVAQLARRLAGATPPLAADIFTAGAAVAPLALVALLAALVGVANFELIAVLAVAGMCYFTLLLYAGLTRAGELREGAAAPTVPAALLLAVWICKIVIVA